MLHALDFSSEFVCGLQLRFPRTSQSMIDLRKQMKERIRKKKPAPPFLIVQSTQHNFVNLNLGTKLSDKQFHLFETTVRCCFLLLFTVHATAISKSKASAIHSCCISNTVCVLSLSIGEATQSTFVF